MGISQGTRNGRVKKPTPKQVENGTYKLIDNKWHKLCTGPAHDIPVYLPATDKYFHVRHTLKREGEFMSRCRLCVNWNKLKSPGESGLIAVEKIHPYYVEITNRIGIAELSRRSGVSDTHIQDVLMKRQATVQKRTLKKIMLELVSARRNHETSINAQSLWRVIKRANGHAGVCSGCGAPMANYTEGCPQCWERRTGKRDRKNTKPAEAG